MPAGEEVKASPPTKSPKSLPGERPSIASQPVVPPSAIPVPHPLHGQDEFAISGEGEDEEMSSSEPPPMSEALEEAAARLKKVEIIQEELSQVA